METIRKINVNNQMVLVLAKEGNTYYKWLEDKTGNKGLDPFWNSKITEDIYNQVIEDYNNGLIKSFYGDFPTVNNPFINLSDSNVLNITNWIAHAYMTWDKNTMNWKYGRNKNYNEELNEFTTTEAEKFNYQLLGRLESDCKYYLGYGNRYKNHLWAGDEQKQIEKMKEIYNSFSDEKKPEWLTMDQINEYEKEMIK